MEKIIKVSSCNDCPFTDRSGSEFYKCKKDEDIWVKVGEKSYNSSVHVDCPLGNSEPDESCQQPTAQVKTPATPTQEEIASILDEAFINARVGIVTISCEQFTRLRQLLLT